MKPKTAIAILIIIFVLALLFAGFLYWKFKIVPMREAEEQVEEQSVIPANKSQAADWAAEQLKNNPNNTATVEEKSRSADWAAEQLKKRKEELSQ